MCRSRQFFCFRCVPILLVALAGGMMSLAAELASAPAPAAKETPLWSLQPLRRPIPPRVQNSNWARNPIDLFILARLEQSGLAPSPPATRLALLRRLSFNLTGLPPAPDVAAAFLADDGSDAGDRLVERLLNSPQHGERWARHWLDLVHFGESHGYDKDKPRPNAWPFRDYVIASLNSDKPYARFVQEQLAGDVLFPEDPQALVATGFIAAGPWDFVGHIELPESKTDGLIARYNDRDDMVMTAMSTFQSLTVHCARCHNHKFDPIPQADYYRLQAVFAGVDRADRAFDPDPTVFAQRKKLTARKQHWLGLEEKLRPILASIRTPAIEQINRDISALELELQNQKKESPGNGYHSEIASSPAVVKWVEIDLTTPRALDEIRLVPARPTDFPDTPGFGFPVRFKLEGWTEAGETHPSLIFDSTGAEYPNPGDQPAVFPAGGQTFRWIRLTATRLWKRTGDYVLALAEWQAMSHGTNAALAAPVAAADSIESGRWARKYLTDNFDSRKSLGSAGSVPSRPAEDVRGLIASKKAERDELLRAELDPAQRAEATEIAQGLRQVNALLEALPSAQKVYAAASEFAASGNFRPAKSPRPVHLLQRGDVRNPRDLMLPGALACIPELSSDFSDAVEREEGARRAALARWITDPKNPLTARSIVNRVWQYHFGRGLVDTPNDFGRMGTPPSHPELLDWLAGWFLDNGQSLKRLHRLIVTSATYRQASDPNPAFEGKDSDNRLYWRMNRQRLEAEAYRDSVLFVSGQLDLKMGGPSSQQFIFKDDHSPIYDYASFDPETPSSRRRSIYRFIVRSVPDPLMETLDCPDASLLTPRRTASVTALQALATLNDRLLVKQAELWAKMVADGTRTIHDQVAVVFEKALNHPPAPPELLELEKYAAKHGLANTCRVILNMNEFLFVD